MPSSISSTSSDTKAAQGPTQMKAVSLKRLTRELEQLKVDPPACLTELHVDPKNVRKLSLALQPRFHPFKYGVFRLKLDVHAEHPFKPPRLQFLTPIHHPNVDATGRFCLSVLQMDNWKASTSIRTVLEALLALLENPEPERALRPELAEQFLHRRAEFYKTAATRTRLEARPK